VHEQQGSSPKTDNDASNLAWIDQQKRSSFKNDNEKDEHKQ